MSRLLGHAAKVVDLRSARSRQRKVGASEIGVCRRRAAYSHHGVTPSNPENTTGLPAVAGTWFHKGALETMRKQWGVLIETTVEDDDLRGHVDAIELPNYWRQLCGMPDVDDAPDEVIVDDLKTKRDAWMVSYVRTVGPKRSELFQVHLYGDLLRRGHIGPKSGRWKNSEKALAAAAPKGLPVETVRLRYMPRTGEEDVEYVHVQPFDETIAEEAWSWVGDVVSSTSAESMPRDEDGPGLSVACDHCPWLTACWGEAGGEHAAQSLLVVTDRDLAATLEEYHDGRTQEKAGKQRKDLARKMLDATTPAVYTDGDKAWKLTWSGGTERAAHEEPDVDAMLELFAEAGIRVPMREVEASRTSRTIGVVPWEEPEPKCGKPVGDPEPVQLNGVWYTQDRPRGGWTVSYLDEACDMTGPDDTITAGKFAKAFPEYVDPRPPCVRKKAHSGECLDSERIVDLTPNFDDESAEEIA